MLTIEQQKRLTEFDGSCWHVELSDMLDTESGYICPLCDEPATHVENYTEVVSRLDFSDWRVVGRLIEKVGGVSCNLNSGWSARIYNTDFYGAADTPQEAIYLAIDNYLKEREWK